MKSIPTSAQSLLAQREKLLTRREVLLAAAGGSLAVLFGMSASLLAEEQADDWQVLGQVLQHLFPTEPDSPGAMEINALAYIKGLMQDSRIDQSERDFILQGVFWLRDLSKKRRKQDYLQLEADQQTRLLLTVAQSEAGENWISTLLTYIFEALLTAPAYGGNSQRIGWKWLQYRAGYPLPDASTLHWKLPQ